MGRIIQSPPFRHDLIEIFAYLGERSPRAAESAVNKIGAALETLSTFPNMGRVRNEFQTGLRSFVVDHYVIFYQPPEDGIEAIRVLHGARDIAAIFHPPGN